MQNNFLDNGAILPHGLLGEDTTAMLHGFSKSYENFALKVGVVVATYTIDDSSNRSKLSNEYDVVIIEQNADKGATPIIYRNCLSAEGLGSIADFFEASLRPQKKKTRKGNSTDLKGQDGAIVLMLCLDGMADKGIIIGALKHPDRKSTIVSAEPHLEGEYNGVNIKVETDGSSILTFKGATDNSGQPLDPSQGNTIIKIEKDGSYQVNHKTVTQRLDKNGKYDLTTDDDVSNTTKKSFNVTATENVNITATKDFSIKCQELIASAEGSSQLQCQKLQVQAESEINLSTSQFQLEAESLAQIKASTVILEGNVALGSAGGQPVLILSTRFIGTGNLGRPVISNVLTGYAKKVTAT